MGQGRAAAQGWGAPSITPGPTLAGVFSEAMRTPLGRVVSSVVGWAPGATGSTASTPGRGSVSGVVTREDPPKRPASRPLL